MKRAFSISLLLFVVASVHAGEPGITMKTEPVDPGTGTRKAIVYSPELDRPEVRSEIEPLPSDTGWTMIDSMVLHCLIPAGERLAVLFDSATETLRDTLLPEYLTDLGRLAVEVAPDWLKDDLADNLRRLGSITQDRYADLIINCPDKRYYDELCFQVAHLSPATFITMDSRLLVDNVELAYRIDPELSYVDIVDYGDALQGGDYYSTTTYRAIVEDETTQVEIPREVYYWWVVMPKITDEQPRYVYDMFWREYLFYHCDSTYPLLREKLTRTQILWNGERQNWTNQGQGYPDTLPAVAVVARWVAHTVPQRASGNRPIQPNQIAHEHNGNCGELQDILCAGARAALIPCGGVMDINEDHVWCEIWWQGEFHPWQVDWACGATNIKNPGIAYDRRHGGSKEVSGLWDWRNDGWQRSVVTTYSDACTLTVDVRDATGRPVDGAIVKILSEGWHSTQFINCFFGVTDRSGRYTTTLGDWQNYHLRVVSTLGSHSGGQIIDSAACEPWVHFFYGCTLDGNLDSLVIQPDSGTPLDVHRLDVSFDVGHEVVYGHDCWNSSGANEYALVKTPGAIDFFIARQEEFDRYAAGQAFSAFETGENASAGNYSLVLPGAGNYYAVLSNEEQEKLTAFCDVTARLYKRGVGIAGPGEPAGPQTCLNVEPNPFHEQLKIRLGAGRGRAFRIRILDRTGRLVRELDVPVQSGTGVTVWDGRDETGSPVSPGVYFCHAGGHGWNLTRPVVFLGGLK